MNVIATCILILFSLNSFSQSSFRIQIDSLECNIPVFNKTADGGYIIAAAEFSPQENVFVIKLDSSGGLMWSKSYQVSTDDIGDVEIRTTSDTGFYLMAYPLDAMFSQYPIIKMMKLDKEGNILAAKTTTWNTSPEGERVYFSEVEPGTDHIYGIALYTYKSGSNPSDPEYSLLKFDTSLNTIFNVFLPLSDHSNSQPVIELVGSDNIPDGVIIGTRGSSNFPGYCQFIRVDTIGNLLWNHIYSYPSNASGVTSVCQSDSNFYVLETREDLAIRKIDYFGNIIYYKKLISAVPVPLYANGGHIGRGDSTSMIISVFPEKVFNGVPYSHIIKIDSAANVLEAFESTDSLYKYTTIIDMDSEILSSRYFYSTKSFQFERNYTSLPVCNYTPILLTTALYSFSDSAITDTSFPILEPFFTDIIPVSTIAPVINSLCISTTQLNEISNPNLISFHPNPSTDKIYFTGSSPQGATIKILDSTGRLIRHCPFKKEIDISTLIPGFYYLQIHEKNLWKLISILIKM